MVCVITILLKTLCSADHTAILDQTTWASKIVSEYDQEILQSQTADKLTHREEEPHNNHEAPGRQTKQSNQLSFPSRLLT